VAAGLDAPAVGSGVKSRVTSDELGRAVDVAPPHATTTTASSARQPTIKRRGDGRPAGERRAVFVKAAGEHNRSPEPDLLNQERALGEDLVAAHVLHCVQPGAERRSERPHVTEEDLRRRRAGLDRLLADEQLSGRLARVELQDSDDEVARVRRLAQICPRDDLLIDGKDRLWIDHSELRVRCRSERDEAEARHDRGHKKRWTGRHDRRARRRS